MKYRKATIQDFESLSQLRTQLKEDELDKLDTEYARYSEKYDRPWLKKCLKSRKVPILIAEENNRVYAHAILHIEKVSPKMARYYTYTKKATLVHLYVDRNNRRQGIATNLIKYTLQYLKEQKADFLDLECYITNSKADSLYTKLGFKNVWIKKRIKF